MRYFLDISYKGTGFHGWQIQPNGNTVQAEIEQALSTILKSTVSIVGSGRTDTGVHARQQVAHFDFPELDTEDLTYKLNSFLPSDISINSTVMVRDDANARFDAISRTYHYHIHQHKDPFLSGISYYFRPELDLGLIEKACQVIVGWQNFECFSKVHTDVSHFNCDIFRAHWQQHDGIHLFEISANRFLRGMVRAVVGTLIDVGLGKTSVEDLKFILQSNDRSRAGRSVPAVGLSLQKVSYPTDIYIN